MEITLFFLISLIIFGELGMASKSKNKKGKKYSLTSFSTSTSSYDSKEEDASRRRLRRDAIQFLREYALSLHQTLREKNRTLAKYLISRRMGETAMVEAIKEWALATVQAVKTRAQETGGELKGAVQRRWGVKRVGRRNAFASTGHRQKEEPGTGGPLARARNHHAHHDFEVF